MMSMLRVGFWTALLAASSVHVAFAEGEHPELPRRIGTESDSDREDRLAWWRRDRFGMFIHFGLYSVAARHEWAKTLEGIDDQTYDARYLAHFNPDLLDVRAWAKTARSAGMRYVVLTAKHHEGFCLWDTDTTDYKITRSAFGRDLLREYVDAFRAEGLRVGIYYSVIDWHHPDYTVDSVHPLMREADRHEKGRDAGLASINASRNMDRYRAYLFAQVRELLTRYGRIDIIWYDYTPKGKYGKSYRDWNSVELVRLTRQLQPDIIIDSRLDLMDTDDGWDFVTPEQFKPQVWPTVRGRRVPWETCHALSENWCYVPDQKNPKDVRQMIGLLCGTVARGGNLILNVGPNARGEIAATDVERLVGLSRWMHWNSRAIYGCTAVPDGFVTPNGTELTYNPKTNRIYVHLLDYPMGFLPLDFFDRVAYAQFLHDGSEIALVAPKARHNQNGEQQGEKGGLALPMRRPSVPVPVVELFLK